MAPRRIPGGPSYFEMRVHPVRGVRFLPPSLSLLRVPAQRAGRALPASRGPWLIRVRAAAPGRLAQQSMTQPRGWQGEAGPSRQCEPSAPPGKERGIGARGAICHSSAAPRGARGCPVLQNWARAV